MRIKETEQLFTQACEFPIDADELTEQLGDVEIEAPTGDTATLATVFARSNATTYASAEDVFTTLMGNLDESFIGRKYYDDRGDNQPHPKRSW